MNRKNFSLLSLVVVAILSRFLPHPPNFTAIGGVVLFSMVSFSSWRVGILVVFISLLISDMVLGFHATQLFVYGAFAAGGALVRWMALKTPSQNVVFGAPIMTASFFIISNFGVWLSSGMYAMSWQGLVQCYVMAIPFLGNQLAGDMLFSAALFGAHAYLSKRLVAFRA